MQTDQSIDSTCQTKTTEDPTASTYALGKWSGKDDNVVNCSNITKLYYAKYVI